MVTESEALKMELLMPVYVVPEDEQLLYMYAEVKHAAATKSASIMIRGERSQKETDRLVSFCCVQYIVKVTEL